MKRGVGYVPQVRNVFGTLSVDENLRMGIFLRPDRFEERRAAVHELFPVLKERRANRAEALSGGQRQVLAMGRALMMEPSLMLLDEPSAGLSPGMQDEVFTTIEQINAAGVSVLIVEQNAHKALRICDRGYVLDQGVVAHTGTGDMLINDPARHRAVPRLTRTSPLSARRADAEGREEPPGPDSGTACRTGTDWAGHGNGPGRGTATGVVAEPPSGRSYVPHLPDVVVRSTTASFAAQPVMVKLPRVGPAGGSLRYPRLSSRSLVAVLNQYEVASVPAGTVHLAVHTPSWAVPEVRVALTMQKPGVKPARRAWSPTVLTPLGSIT